MNDSSLSQYSLATVCPRQKDVLDKEVVDVSTGTCRVLLYSHDSQGLGHLRRNLSLAHHLARSLGGENGEKSHEKTISGLIVTGLVPVHGFSLPTGFDWLVLPGISKGSEGYRPRSLAAKTKEVISLRSALLRAALNTFQPDLVIVDRHLHGVRSELRAPLEELRRQHPATRIVLGLREVLDAPEACELEWLRLGPTQGVRDLVDEIWIYGDRRVHDTLESGEIPRALHDKCHFVGYLANGRALGDSHIRTERPFVLTTVGGGQDGAGVLRAAVSAALPHGYDHVIVTGPQLEEAQWQELASAAGPHTHVHRSLPGLGERIKAAAAVITMGGYNSVAEVLASDTPALVIPREKPRAEQLIRAHALAECGALEVMTNDELSALSLSRWLSAAVGQKVDRSHIDGDGLTGVALRAHALLSGSSAAKEKNEPNYAPRGDASASRLCVAGGAR